MRAFFITLLLIAPISQLHAQTVNSILQMLTTVVISAVPVAILIALAVFFWGVVKMIAGLKVGQSDKVIEEGKKRMMWGIVGLFMAVSIWGVVEILRTTFVATNPTSRETPVITW